MLLTRLDRLLPDTLWRGWLRWALWALCIGAFVMLAAIRVQTDAEMAFASLAIVPVLLISWVGGRGSGLLAAALAAGTWLLGDFASDRANSAPWIPWANAATRMMTYSLVALLASQVRLQFRREHEDARRDVLTGLRNRRAFIEAGESEVARAKRYAHPMAVAFLDLDDFKQLNDTVGHEAGDDALRSAAAALASALRSSDLVARMGGDEFAVLIPESDYDAASEVGKKLACAINHSLRAFPPVRASLGIAWFGHVDRTFEEMLKAADGLMYEVKERGKGEVCIRRITSGK